ncbi:MAG: hypothetical protein ACT4OS_12670 [Acidimicrobiales bacterium]
MTTPMTMQMESPLIAPAPAPSPGRLTSRAVVRIVEAGNSASCAHCGLLVKFRARHRLTQVIANVYVDGRWARVEHYHSNCYDEAGQPYGLS